MWVHFQYVTANDWFLTLTYYCSLHMYTWPDIVRAPYVWAQNIIVLIMSSAELFYIIYSKCVYNIHSLRNHRYNLKMYSCIFLYLWLNLALAWDVCSTSRGLASIYMYSVHCTCNKVDLRSQW